MTYKVFVLITYFLMNGTTVTMSNRDTFTSLDDCNAALARHTVAGSYARGYCYAKPVITGRND